MSKPVFENLKTGFSHHITSFFGLNATVFTGHKTDIPKNRFFFRKKRFYHKTERAMRCTVFFQLSMYKFAFS